MAELGAPGAAMASMAVASLVLFLATSVLFALWLARSFGIASRREDRAGARHTPTGAREDVEGGGT